MDHAGTGRRPSARLRTRLIFSRSFWPSRRVIALTNERRFARHRASTHSNDSSLCPILVGVLTFKPSSKN
jgi:hypothetical protein